MFFRREKVKVVTFTDVMDSLRSKAYKVEPEAGGGMRVSKNGFGAVMRDKSPLEMDKPGLLIGNEIGLLVDAGYQKYWQTPSNVKLAAEASHLRGLHDFTEDLREAVGLISVYNTALGTVNELHLYDRVKDRDFGVPKRPWED